MDTRIVLGGGGDAAESHEGHAVFAAWLGGSPRSSLRDRPHTSPRVLYLPIAMGRDRELLSAADRWMNETFAPFDVDRIHTVFRVEDVTQEAIDTADGVYIGGGNTFRLLHELVRSGAMRLLREAALGGVPLYGGSAGAIILGACIRTASHLDENEVGLEDTAGLDLANGCSVWPHYGAGGAAAVEAYVKTTGERVIAIPETSAVVVEGVRAYALGEDVRLYSPTARADGSPHSVDLPRYRPCGDPSTTTTTEGAP